MCGVIFGTTFHLRVYPIIYTIGIINYLFNNFHCFQCVDSDVSRSNEVQSDIDDNDNSWKNGNGGHRIQRDNITDNIDDSSNIIFAGKSINKGDENHHCGNNNMSSNNAGNSRG